MDKDLYGKIDTQKNVFIEKIKNNIQTYLIFLVLLFNIALEIVSQLYTIGFVNPFTIEFFLDLAVSLTTTMICYMCFIPFGVAQERKAPQYSQNLTLWGRLTDTIRGNYNEAFRLFCHSQVEEERNDKRRMIIGNNTMISYEEYEEKYKGLDRARLKAVYKSGEISKIEYKAIRKANGFTLFKYTKVRPINPIIILSGVNKMNINDAGRTNNAYATKWLVSRPFIIFITSAIINAISTTFIGAGKNAIFDMFLSVLLIIMASICGYSAGVTSAKKDNEKVKSRIMFLSLFCEKNGVKTH